jgi:peptidoglycan/LPS O-acetylase OafA/YrhL
MKTGFSVWLDLLRIVATVTVLVSHVAYPRFTDGIYQWIRDLNVGSDAVILFFVISGIVIARAAERDGTLSRYAFNRTTRMYSVMIPALLLTFSFDSLGYGIDPAAYLAPFYQPLPLDEFLLRGLTFSNQWLVATPVRLGTNGPLWSLSYEVAYYLLFGAMVFLTGALRAAIVFILLIVVGLNALLLMPAWLMGVWLWRRLRAGDVPCLAQGTWLVLAVLPLIAYGLALGISLPERLLHLTEALLPAAMPIERLRFSNEFVWNGLLGALVTLHLFAMSQLLTDWRHGTSAIRWLAQASFSVYVTHYPVLHLIDAILPEDAPGRVIWFLIGSLVVGLAFAQVFERPLERWRRMLRPSAFAMR